MPLGTAEPLRWGSKEGPGLQNGDCVLPAPKRTVFSGKPMATHCWQSGLGEQGYYPGAGAHPEISEGTQGTMPWGDEHWHGLSLPLDYCSGFQLFASCSENIYKHL